MQQVSDHVDAVYLQQPPPRPLSPIMLVNLLGDHMFERPLRTVLHPLFVVSFVVLIMLLALRVQVAWIALPLGVVVGMLFFSGSRILRHVWEDVRLLRKGMIIRAHILKLRANHTLAGEINGALLDCAIPMAARRTYVGSIWLADGNEAQRLLRQGRLQVICLPQTPGTWRVIEPIQSDVRYDRVGPSVAIPPDA